MKTSLAFLATISSLSTLAAAANTYSNDDINNRPDYVMHDAAPMWHFAVNTCYPTGASDGNGQQTKGNDYPAGDICKAKQGDGCQDPGPWKGYNTHGSDFPSYGGIAYCKDKNEYRINYSVYFKHDTGHVSDWEYASVRLGQDPKTGRWYRIGMMFEQDGKIGWTNWGDLDTFDSVDEALKPGVKQGKNHAKVYVTKGHHAMYPNPMYSKADCSNFRPNDYYYYSGDWLEKAEKIPDNWIWGQAKSTPQGLLGRGIYWQQNICNK